MQAFRKINNIAGWTVGLISLIVYVFTLEPSASFWDCGEFIAVSYKLEVPHPPGAPLFLLIGRIFSFLALNNPEKVAFWINFSSAVSSALTNVFLFWTITLLVRKIVKPQQQNQYTLSQIIVIIGAGAVGALANAFSDSFWFSAVEAEVYAMSSLATAIVFWMILKWEEAVSQQDKYADKWILMIAYTIGLSIGVHLLNLLTIPALGMVYYFKRYKFSWSGAILAFAISMGILLFVQYAIIPGIPSLALKFDIAFVNGIGLPFNSGAIFLMLLIAAGIIFGLRYAHQKNYHLLNLGLLSLALILIGYLSYMTILIRSNANPNIDENNPEDLPRFISYLKREQYGDRPLFRGGSYNSHGNGEEDLAATYEEGDSIYFVDKKNNRYTGLDVKPIKKWLYPVAFPRMHSEQPQHIQLYKQYNSNLSFFIDYQIIHMYWRYFMWNFAGRASDEQDARWEDGIFRRVSEPNNKASNHYYLLPFLVGLIGLFYHYTVNKKDTAVIGTLFFMTGIAIVIYLNQTPYQPRERDYSYVGSFYAFCIWIGIGVVGLFEWLKGVTKLKDTLLAGITVAVCTLAVPVLMIAQNWDDHDRSGRYFCPDSARNILESCDENAILITNGDNDTFPLWYLQEVEGVRTDVRVVNLSLLRTDWYAWQLKHLKNGKSEPLPITIPDEEYIGEKMAYMTYRTTTLELPVDKQNIRKQVSSDIPDTQIPDVFKWTVTPRNEKNGVGHLVKDDIMLLNIIENNAKQGWKRPIYVSMTVPIEGLLTSMQPYFQVEGMCYRFVPIRNNDNSGRVDIQRTQSILDKKFRYRGLNNPKLYFDEQAQHMVSNYRNVFYRLASAYIEKGNKNEAKAVLEKSLSLMPSNCVPMDAFAMLSNADIYEKCDDKLKAEKLRKEAEAICKRALDKYEPESSEYKRHKSILAYMIGTYGQAGNTNKAIEIAEYLYQKTGDPEYQQYVQMIKANPNFFKPEPEKPETLIKDTIKVNSEKEKNKSDSKK
ncbi:MAG: DUF2723 domain-containing protein [Bacteroidia bacterium]|nr:DUF2723 domain-containing protein [Bacteroidia bacterium]